MPLPTNKASYPNLGALKLIKTHMCKSRTSKLQKKVTFETSVAYLEIPA